MYRSNSLLPAWMIDTYRDDNSSSSSEPYKKRAPIIIGQASQARHHDPRQWVMVLFRLILPSFITNGLYGRSRNKGTTPPRPTAYLDGLRGVAAFVVYIFHYTYLWFPVLRNGYGSSESNHLFWQLPVVRVIHSGRASVSVFFLISGYVLSIKTISIIKASGTKLNSEKVLQSISGSILRRPFRLYPSIIVQTAIIAALARLPGLHLPTVDNNPSTIPPTLATASEQFWHWLSMLPRQFNPFLFVPGRETQFPNLYDGHLWTIPVEWNGSLLVFLCLAALSRSQVWVRVSVLALGAAWALQMGYCDQALFLMGPLLAEVSLTWPPYHALAPSDDKKWNANRLIHFIGHATTLSLFILGCHLCSWPENKAANSIGYQTLVAKYTPPQYRGNETSTQLFWLAWGGVFIILALMYSPPICFDSDGEPLLQRLFTNRVASYLGEISYSMYLCHSSVIEIVGMRFLRPAWYAWFDADQEAQILMQKNQLDNASAIWDALNATYIKKWAVSIVINTFVLFWVSDLFNRAVDARTVRFSRRIGGRVEEFK